MGYFFRAGEALDDRAWAGGFDKLGLALLDRESLLPASFSTNSLTPSVQVGPGSRALTVVLVPPRPEHSKFQGFSLCPSERSERVVKRIFGFRQPPFLTGAKCITRVFFSF
jgi:hypothetical protein